MGAVKEMYLTMLDRLQEQGGLHAAEHAELPGDMELIWTARRILMGEGVAELLDEVDEVTLVDLRDAYDEGRKPDIIDLDEVVNQLAKLGVPAYVEQTGGGCATIYAGTPQSWPDQYGDRRYAAAAGPGWFEGPAWTKGRGHTDEFYFGPDDDGDTDGDSVPDKAQPPQIAQMIAGVVRDVEARRWRVDTVLETAGKAFWRAVAEGFPEVTTGDFGPDETLAIEQAMRKAVLLWLHYNLPEEGVAPTAVAAGGIVAARMAAAVERLLPLAERVNPTWLWDLVHDMAHADADAEFAHGDFAPISDDTALDALRDRANDRVNEAQQAGKAAAVELLVEVLGEQRAEQMLRAVTSPA